MMDTTQKSTWPRWQEKTRARPQSKSIYKERSLPPIPPEAREPFTAPLLPTTKTNRPSPPAIPPRPVAWSPQWYPLAIFATAAILVVLAILVPSPLSRPGQKSSGPGAGLSQPPTFGTLSFESSGNLDPSSSTGINDGIVVSLSHIPEPKPHMRDAGWLLPDSTQETTPALFLGNLSIIVNTSTHLRYHDPLHRNLLATYSRFLVSEEPSSATPLAPTLDRQHWVVQAAIPDLPTAGDRNGYSLLTHVRHLLAQDPTLDAVGLNGGLTVWLSRNMEKILEWSTSARDDWNQPGNADLLRREIERILQYLDGQAYAWHDVPAHTPLLVDPHAGRFGLIAFEPGQQTPDLIDHITFHLAGMVNAPGSTATQRTLATSMTNVLTNAGTTSILAQVQTIRRDAIHLVTMPSTQLMHSQQAQTLLDDMATNANGAYVGHVEDGTPGVAWIVASMQRLVQLPILRAATPDSL